jgi:hypothetical protein
MAASVSFNLFTLDTLSKFRLMTHLVPGGEMILEELSSPGIMNGRKRQRPGAKSRLAGSNERISARALAVYLVL